MLSLLFLLAAADPYAGVQIAPEYKAKLGLIRRKDGSRAPRQRSPLIDPDDYPERSRAAGEQGLVVTSVTVDISGKPIACVIVQSSGFPRLDEDTCALILQKDYFDPALDAAGHPVQESTEKRVLWRK